MPARPVITGRLTVVGPFAISRTTVRILGSFLWFYRIEAIERTLLGGTDRYLMPGERALVPKRAVRRVQQSGADTSAMASDESRPGQG